MQRKKIDGKKRKGQVSIIDFSLAIFIFAIMFTFLLISWYGYYDKLVNRLNNEEMISLANEITDNFVKKEGFPADWTKENVEIIGLASYDRKLSDEKVQEFCNMEPLEARQKLNLAYNFYFHIIPKGEAPEVEYGMEPTEKGKVVTVYRVVVYQDAPAILKFSLWR